MTSVRYAAFHPVFFLHHCNVDRIYQRHVTSEGPAECAAEFRQRQAQLALQGESVEQRVEVQQLSAARLYGTGCVCCLGTRVGWARAAARRDYAIRARVLRHAGVILGAETASVRRLSPSSTQPQAPLSCLPIPSIP
eukprot:1485706-Rhodomonas_salina.1